MTPRARRFAVLAAACLVLAAFAAPAAACSCLAPGPPQQEMEKTDAVFSGRVVALDRDEAQSGEIRFPRLRVTLELDRVWKGCAEGDEVVLWTALDSAACGYGFEEGERYVVYAYETDDGGLTTNLCSRTQRLAVAGEDLQALGEPRRTVETGEGDPPE